MAIGTEAGTPLYPVTVKLTGEDGNAFAIMAQVRKAIISAGGDNETVTQFLTEAMSSDYDNLLRVVMKYVKVV